MEGRVISNNIVNINILFLMNVIEIMVFFKNTSNRKTSFIFYIVYTRAEMPYSSGFQV